MAIINKTIMVQLYTTPNELRRLADNMEAYYRQSNFGQDLTTAKWYNVDNGIEVHFIINQELMDKQT